MLAVYSFCLSDLWVPTTVIHFLRILYLSFHASLEMVSLSVFKSTIVGVYLSRLALIIFCACATLEMVSLFSFLEAMHRHLF
jgi:hypothetical protein